MNALTNSLVKGASLHSAMALAFGEIEAATKSANNPHFKSKYADITTVIDAIKPALVRHDLFFTQEPELCEAGIVIVTRLHHAGGESMFLGRLFVPANKQDAQGFGSALTYARRYALVTAFGVPVEDDDGNAAARGIKQGARDEPPAAVINDAQYAEIVRLMEAARVTTKQFNERMGCKTVNQLPANQFEEARELLNDRLAKLVKSETDAKAKENA